MDSSSRAVMWRQLADGARRWARQQEDDVTAVELAAEIEELAGRLKVAEALSPAERAEVEREAAEIERRYLCWRDAVWA